MVFGELSLTLTRVDEVTEEGLKIEVGSEGGDFASGYKSNRITRRDRTI